MENERKNSLDDRVCYLAEERLNVIDSRAVEMKALRRAGDPYPKTFNINISLDCYDKELGVELPPL